MSEEKKDTMVNLMPTLRKINVPVGKLILDPNNPRFLEHDDNLTDESNFLDQGIDEETRNKMRKDAYQINELEKSIKTNGWLPVDQIFVRKLKDSDYYVVQEGNRRVTAIRNLLKNEPDLDGELRQSIESLNVMEIEDTSDPRTLQIQISYLLGVRHHGSLKKWSAFAQAHRIYVQYIRLSNQSDETFHWDNEVGEQIADALSIDQKRVEERLRVYRVMKQIDSQPKVQDVGGIKGEFYSLCWEVIQKRGKSKLPEYIRQDSDTMLLDEESLERMDNLCHFSTPERDGAPMRNPSEWRNFDKILQEDDDKRRAELIAEVEENKRTPSAVWAEREEELFKLRWETWLNKVLQIISRVQFGDDLESDEAKKAGRRLDELLVKLHTKASKEGKAE